MNWIAIGMFFLLLFVMPVSKIYCQKKFQPAYIIMLNGDTVKGSIDYREKESNPDKIKFAKSNSTDLYTYTPFQIKKFVVAGEIYESARVNVDKGSASIGELTYVEDLSMDTITVFLRMLIDGEKSLYYYKSKMGAEHFFIKQNAGYEWLIHKFFLKDTDGKTVESQNTTYRQQLSSYFKNCTYLKEDLESVSYSIESFQELFNKYFRCMNSSSSFDKKNIAPLVDKGILAGYYTITLKAYNSANYFYSSTGNSASGFTAGGYININFTREKQGFSFYNDLIFINNKLKTTYRDNGSGDNYTTYNLNLDLSYLKLNTMLRYRIPYKNFLFYANAGISNGLLLKQQIDIRKETKFYSTTDIINDKLVGKKHEESYLLGIGSQFKSFSFDLRLEKGSGMNDLGYYRFTTSKFFFLLSYKL